MMTQTAMSSTHSSHSATPNARRARRSPLFQEISSGKTRVSRLTLLSHMKNLRRKLLAPYHYLWARLSALWYGSPSRRLTVIGVTGTKGKSSVADMLYAIFTTAGHTTALASTIRFVLGAESRPNLFKMTLPGRGFIQKFLSRAAAKSARM